MEQLVNNKYSPLFRQLLFLVALIGIGALIWTQLSFFMSAFLGAITLYVVLRKPFFYLTEKRRWRTWAASLSLVAAIALLLGGVGFFVYRIVATELSSVDVSLVLNSLETQINALSGYIPYSILPKDIFAQSKGLITQLASGLLNTAYSFIFNLFMMIFVLYFMLANARKLEKTAVDYLPFSSHSIAMIKAEVKNMIYGNVIGLPLIMLVQGTVAGLGYWLLGINDAILWAFLTAITGLIPVVGTAAVWLPLSIFMLLNQQTWQGIVLIAYGILIISNADNACRLVLMKKMAHTHPLIIIFGVILGIPLFGFWGIIFGPLLISGFLLLIKIYKSEYGNNEELKMKK